MKKWIINNDGAKILKSPLGDNSINTKNWGVEYADNALDYAGSHCTFHIIEEFVDEEGNPTGRPKLLKIYNDGSPLPIEDVREKLFSIPLTYWDRPSGAIGHYGHGATDSSFAVGYIKEVESFNIDNVPYKVCCVPCIDDDATIPHKSIGMLKHSDMVNEVRSYKLEEVEVKDIPSNRFSLTIEFFEDSNVLVTRKSLEEAMSLRYGQLNNFIVRIKNSSVGTDYYDIPVRKTYFGCFDVNGNLVSSVNQIKKIPELFEYDGVQWEISYCTAVSDSDFELHKKYEKMVGDDFTFSLEESRDKGWPIFGVMNHTGVVMTVLPKGFGYGKGYSYDSAQHLRLRFFLKPKSNISSIFAQNKANGFKSDDYQRGMSVALKNFLKKHDIRSEYAGTRKKMEDSRVEQFRDKITGETAEGKLLAFQFGGLLGAEVDIKGLRDFDNWVLFAKDTSTREIDARNEDIGLMMEFQEGTADINHLDGIVGRVISKMRFNSPYKFVIWVAEKHTTALRNRLKEALGGMKWEDSETCLKKVYFMTTQHLIDGFEPSDVSSLDIHKEFIDN